MLRQQLSILLGAVMAMSLLSAVPASAGTLCLDDPALDGGYVDVTRFCIDATPERVRLEVTVTDYSEEPVVFADVPSNEFGTQLHLQADYNEIALRDAQGGYVCLGAGSSQDGLTWTWEMVAFGQRQSCVTSPFDITNIRFGDFHEIFDTIDGTHSVDPQASGGTPPPPGERVCSEGPISAPSSIPLL